MSHGIGAHRIGADLGQMHTELARTLDMRSRNWRALVIRRTPKAYTEIHGVCGTEGCSTELEFVGHAGAACCRTYLGP